MKPVPFVLILKTVAGDSVVPYRVFSVGNQATHRYSPPAPPNVVVPYKVLLDTMSGECGPAPSLVPAKEYRDVKVCAFNPVLASWQIAKQAQAFFMTTLHEFIFAVYHRFCGPSVREVRT